MNITLLGQGFEPISEFSVGKQIIKFLADTSFHTFTGISAFASQAGVNGLSAHINSAKKHLKIITIVTGIDQKGTSQEALEALLNLEIDAFIFYQPSFTIFHPKIYLFEGEHKTKLIIGSSNLTAQGLFTNVEASLLVSIDNSSIEDKKIVEQLKEYFKGIFYHSDPNLKKLSTELISDLVIAKVVPTEAERKAAQDKAEKSERQETDNIISKIFPKRDLPKIPKEFRGLKTQVSSTKTTDQPIGVSSVIGKLVWTRKVLPKSSVQRSIGNPTGGLRLVQDDFTVDGEVIDQTQYFRKEVFRAFPWVKVKDKPYVEATTVPFDITIKGDFKGRFELEVRHKPSGEAGQHNYTTSISWGEIGPTIYDENLTGSRLDIFEAIGKEKIFHLIIS
jgi:HKD family nuclease